MRECHPEVFSHRFTVLGWVGRKERAAERMCVLRVSSGEEGREREKEGGKVNGIKDVLLSQFYVTVFSCIMSGRFSKDRFY